MANILYLIAFVISLSVIANDEHKHGQQSCHEACKAQHPDVNSAEHQACMAKCGKDSK